MAFNENRGYLPPEVNVTYIAVEQGFQLSNHLGFDVEDWEDGDEYFDSTYSDL
jgi:hypothetical protein